MCIGGSDGGRGGGGGVKVIVEYPGVRWWENVMVAVSTVTAAFARKLHAAFACKGSDCCGDGKLAAAMWKRGRIE